MTAVHFAGIHATSCHEDCFRILLHLREEGMVIKLSCSFHNFFSLGIEMVYIVSIWNLRLCLIPRAHFQEQRFLTIIS